jgi:quinol monooxygenase YgiN
LENSARHAYASNPIILSTFQIHPAKSVVVCILLVQQRPLKYAISEESLMFDFAVRVKVGLHKQQEFLQVLRSMQNDQKGEKGIAIFRLYENEEDRIIYDLIARWETEEDMAKYLSGEDFKVLLGAIQVLCEESEIQYKHVPKNLTHHLGALLDSVDCESRAC